MAKTSDIVKFLKKQKYPTREMNRCQICGRNRSYIRHFGMCRICFRKEALAGNIPGVTKASW
ncbi:type Z 30S ribosomal protein S14 [Candidatus Roizmanbacteria bacterium CG10_big_fil_rev_8_21_14_0_10_39_6]|uniref:Small ribosomal subunit protein uS14 n=1 Tax=Candidatus Roizmanbacteria bacterium CG10_big_fil_rev_8_21_14_0_10_39_6 TaxID=1974853 RepID=A0A2M8KSX7_9BACT|nr:MAG: type Z 30S ribosomal protein S14 [Candidatus Roizmanbacteria bacterium CG10_big_fil_rev_8_21_14_0_10_39_6]